MPVLPCRAPEVHYKAHAVAFVFVILGVLQGVAGWGCPGPDPSVSCPTFTDQSCTGIFSSTPALGDSTAAYLASLLAQIAYEPPSGSWEDTARQLLTGWGATSTEFISERRADQVDTQVVVADAPTTVFVFFRGTETSQKADIATDLNTAFKAVEGLGNLHAGFADAEEAVHSQISGLIDTFRASVKPVVYAGHSLGGALANLAAARQQLASSGTVGAVYTFGGARVGDGVWAQAYSDLGLADVTYRYVHGRDPIPLIPPGGSVGFQHVGKQVYMPSGGGCQLDAGDQDYCALSGAGDSSSLCSLPSLVLDGLAWLAEWYSGADNVISADDLKSNEPGLCCSAFGDHGITAYVAALNSTCMDACSQLQLCLCQTYFEQPQAANADPEAFLSPSPPAYRPPAYDTYTLTIVTSCDSLAGTDGTVKLFLRDASGGQTDVWTLNDWGNDFEACDSGTYEVGRGAFVDPSSWEVVVQFDGGVFGDAWKPDYITVATASNAGSTDFCLLEGDPDSPDWLESSGDYIFAPCA